MSFTRNERNLILFFSILLLLGSGIRFYQTRRNAAILSAYEQSYAMLDTTTAAAGSRVRDNHRGQDSADSLHLLESITFVAVNSASRAELELLPRIGPILVQRIIDYRQRHGLFQLAEDLVKIKGIGPKTLETIKPYITL